MVTFFQSWWDVHTIDVIFPKFVGFILLWLLLFFQELNADEFDILVMHFPKILNYYNKSEKNFKKS